MERDMLVDGAFILDVLNWSTTCHLMGAFRAAPRLSPCDTSPLMCFSATIRHHGLRELTSPNSNKNEARFRVINTNMGSTPPPEEALEVVRVELGKPFDLNTNKRRGLVDQIDLGDNKPFKRVSRLINVSDIYFGGQLHAQPIGCDPVRGCFRHTS